MEWEVYSYLNGRPKNHAYLNGHTHHNGGPHAHLNGGPHTHKNGGTHVIKNGGTHVHKNGGAHVHKNGGPHVHLNGTLPRVPPKPQPRTFRKRLEEEEKKNRDLEEEFKQKVLARRLLEEQQAEEREAKRRREEEEFKNKVLARRLREEERDKQERRERLQRESQIKQEEERRIARLREEKLRAIRQEEELKAKKRLEEETRKEKELQAAKLREEWEAEADKCKQSAIVEWSEGSLIITFLPKKESSSYESEEDLTPPATPPLLNGHIVRHQEGLLNGGHDLTLTQSDLHPQRNLTNGDLTHQENHLSVPSKEERPSTPCTDDELSGVNLRNLRSSYLTATNDRKQVDHTEDIEKSRISIKDLVGTYSSPPPSTPPPPAKNCLDDLTPVSFRSLKSAYEATATTPSGAGSRHSSCSSSFGLGGSPHLDQDLSGVSFKHLREEYCRTASEETQSRSSSPCKPAPDTGVSIRQLASTQLSNDCKMCGKQVYQMEKIVAEKASWHKNCFKCKECDKHLTLETYQSHEGNLFCKPHFKELFQPKAVVEDETVARAERSTDKPDYGLEELSSANVKQKFSMFENKAKEKDTRSLEPAHVRRSQSLMNKAARFLKGDEEDSEGEYGVENSRLGEFDEDDDEDEEEEEEEEEESEYEEIEVTDEEAEEEEEIKVNGTKENGQHEEDNEDEEKDDEEKDDEEKDDEEKDEEENEDKDEVKENGIDEEDSKPKKKIKKIIKVKKEKPKKEKKEKRSRRERPASIAGAQAGELKSQWESKNRRDRMRECRSKELSKFRQMLCAGKNTNLKEMFESGKIDNCDSDDERTSRKEQIKIERTHNASRSIKDRFEKGEAYGGADSDEDRNGTDERRECEEIFREAETARAARKRFNQIDSKVKGEGRDIMRSQSFANAPITNRRISQDGGPVDTEIIRSCDIKEDFEIDNTDLASRFKFFTNYEDTENQKVEDKRRSRSFRFTPPKDGVVKVDEEKELMARMPKACMAINCPVCRSRGLEPEAVDFGRDPNLIKSTDKFDDNIDCARTKTLLNMFKKMEMQGSDDDEQGPPPPRRFTPPPEGEEYDSEEYSDEEYTDDDEDDYTDDEEDDEEEDENGVKVPKYKDEVLEMLSARKAANLRAKFEKWENGKNDVNKGSDEEGEEAMPSIDTARNLRKMFENKATEQPVPVNKPKHKVNRFV